MSLVVEPYGLVGLTDGAFTVVNLTTNWVLMWHTYGESLEVAPASTYHLEYREAYGPGLECTLDGIAYGADLEPGKHTVVLLRPIGLERKVHELPAYYFKWGFGVGLSFLGVMILLAIVRNMHRHSPEL